MAISPSGNMSVVESEAMREQRIERLIFEIGQVIREAPLERREELRQMASDLLDEETRLLIASNQQPTNGRQYQPPLNGIALSGFALVLGIGLFLFLPSIGLVIACLGIIGLVLSFIFNTLLKR